LYATGSSKTKKFDKIFSYVLFIVLLPDFVTAITGDSVLEPLDAFCTLCFIIAIISVGLMRADLDNWVAHGHTIAGFVLNPKFSIWIFSNIIYPLFNLMLYVFKLYNPQILSNNRVPFFVVDIFFTNVFFSNAVYLTWKGYLFKDYESQKPPEQSDASIELNWARLKPSINLEARMDLVEQKLAQILIAINLEDGNARQD